MMSLSKAKWQSFGLRKEPELEFLIVDPGENPDFSYEGFRVESQFSQLVSVIWENETGFGLEWPSNPQK